MPTTQHSQIEQNVSFDFKLGFRVAKKVSSRVKSMEAVLSLSMKLLLLFYQIRYSRANNRHSFGFQKRKTTNGKYG